MALRFDMVNSGRWYRSSFTQAGLAKVLITINDALTNEGPLATVATFVAALALLMVFPPCITVLIAIATAIYGCVTTTMLTAGSRYPQRHRNSNKKGHQWWPFANKHKVMIPHYQ
jgi:hypothetical protein